MGLCPPSALSKERLLGLIDAFDATLMAWCGGHTIKDDPVYDLIATRLGEANSVKKEFVRHFLLQPPDSGAYCWLKDDSPLKNLQNNLALRVPFNQSNPLQASPRFQNSCE